MSPEEITLIRTGAAEVGRRADELAERFYDTLFDMAPEVRPMFPSDLAVQRGKLMSELDALITLAVAAAGDDLSTFVARCHQLGRRHVRYGAADAHYPVVGAALVAALAGTIPGWNDDHATAWTKLYRLVSEAMREGANIAATISGGSVVRR